MSDNFVFLSQFLDQEIYLIKKGKTLEKETSEAASEEMLHEVEPEYNTASTKEITLVVEKEFDHEEENLLNNILNSVNISREHANIIIKTEDPDDFEKKLKNIDASKVISFGVTTTKSRLLDIQSKYDPTTVESNTVIIADTLSELNANRDLKKLLWDSLKMIFN